jgi:protein-S-isoprenylcysteine O-methyltransferase Ste14
MIRDHALAGGDRGKKEQHKLVMSGPYRWVRHPFYTSFGMDVVAAGLVMANWFVLLLGAAVFGVLVVRTQREEEFLRTRFGDDYRRYQHRVGRFVPHRPENGL